MLNAKMMNAKTKVPLSVFMPGAGCALTIVPSAECYHEPVAFACPIAFSNRGKNE